MAGRPFGSTKPKIMTDALILALNRAAEDGTNLKRINMVAARLVARAEEGDVPAIREIFDRVDGKVPQTQVHTGDEDGGPVRHELIERVVVYPPQVADPNGGSVPAVPESSEV